MRRHFEKHGSWMQAFGSPHRAAHSAFLPCLGALLLCLGTALLAQQPAPRQKWEVEGITLRHHGFTPRELTRSKRPFLLVVNNRSGLREVSLRLDRVGGGQVRAARVPRRQLDWREPLDLGPGRYVLTEAGHPGWICNITITEGN